MSAESVLIVGGAGFLGAALTQSLTRQGYHVTVLDTYRHASDPFNADYTAAMAYRRSQLADAHLHRGDACDPTDILTAFEAAQPHRVVHLAALAHAPLNERHMAEAVHISTASLVNTLQMAKRFSTKRVMLTSSSYVYGDFRYQPCDEDHPTEPTTAYGAAKLAAEAVLRGVGTALHVPWTIVRLIAVYGPWDLNGKLSTQNLAEAAATGQLPIAGTDGDAGTDYTHVDDAIKGIKLALTHEAAVGQVFNIARSRARTAQKVADILTGLGYPAQPQPERVVGRPKRGVLAIDKARSQLGYTPAIDLEHGLAECLAQATKRPAPATRQQACTMNTAPTPAIDFHGLTDLYVHQQDEIIDAVKTSLRAGPPIDGPPVRELERRCAEALGRHHATAVGSGTEALTLALRACGVGPGDEVIVTSFSFIASASPILYVGATPVYVPVDPTTLHMTPAAVAAACNAATRAVIAVHLFGRCLPAIGTLEELATTHGLHLIEDAAQAFGATYQGRPAGSFGHLSVLSFDPSKVLGGINTGGLVVTDDENLHRSVTTMRGHGHNPSTGEFTCLGVNSRMSSANAAVVLNHLRHQDAWREARARVAEQYHSSLAANRQLLMPPGSTPDSIDNHHKYVLRTAHRDKLRLHLDQCGIPTKVHYRRALPDLTALAGRGKCHGDIGTARDAANQVLSLPIHPFLAEDQISAIIHAIQDYPW